MNLYFELLKKPVFNMKDVNVFYNNMDSARSAIKRLAKDGMVAKIRNNMYTCVSGETGCTGCQSFSDSQLYYTNLIRVTSYSYGVLWNYRSGLL